MKLSSHQNAPSFLILKNAEQALIEQLNSKYAFIDLEVHRDSQLVYQIGLKSVIYSLEKNPHTISLKSRLKLLKKRSIALCGHNFRRFDASYFFDLYPEVQPWSIIDTLELSVIIRPLQASHKLQKDYKPSEYSSNSPSEDARATQRLLNELVSECFSKPPILQQLYCWLLTCGNEEADLAYKDFFQLMIEYGQLPTETQRQQWVKDYFELQSDAFSQSHLNSETEAFYRPVTQADYNRIMGSLNRVQREIVLADEAAIAVIAGPGSGKTRTIVHRIAYLVKVKRVFPDRILVLAYNRNAVKELRLRLQELIGQMAFHLRVFTFHGLALALLGRTLGEERKGHKEINFNEILNQACLLIEQGDEAEDEETQTRRLKLLGNLEYIFVDEYQDVAENEYRLIQLVAGFGQSEDTSRSVQTNLCVIGDDDQNIYEFRGTDVKYIIQFEKEYNAKQYLLVENYRSTNSIIEAANYLIAHNQQRCKRTLAEQVRIDSERNEEKGLPVRAYRFQYSIAQAEWIIQQVKQWIDEGIKPNEIALLAHNWDDLGVIRLGLEKMGIDSYALKKEGIALVRNYVTDRLLNKLRENPNLLLSSSESVYQRVKRFFEQGNRLNEPTVQTLLKIAQDLDQERGYGHPDLAIPISANEIITAIYEFNHSGETYLNENAVLVTSCHGAKGLEFRKVILLADGFKTTEAERRLFYVAMTRAKEELILCATQDSQFVKEANVDCQSSKVNDPSSASQKSLYLDLTPKDINLGYQQTRHQQENIKKLKEGDALQMKVNRWGNGWDILKDGDIIGGLSRLGTDKLHKKGIRLGQFQFQSKEVTEVTVKHIFRWLKTDELTGDIIDDWFVVIPQIRVCR